jgi:excisionase family DNA binding protein
MAAPCRRRGLEGWEGRGTLLDPFLSLRALASYSSLSVRKLRDLLEDAGHPLPAYQVGGKILVRRSEFDGWISAHRRQRDTDVDKIVSEVLRDL